VSWSIWSWENAEGNTSSASLFAKRKHRIYTDVKSAILGNVHEKRMGIAPRDLHKLNCGGAYQRAKPSNSA